ncbi:DsbA family protein [Undibacterium fentianense]|uniref:DsbA family protein n=1 Tax=Undibacterium fentianense TaxID=2828728 RepID=A0A941DYE3_9BURK|nr:DsbA family protein [Undibacterium fentianense]MBR7799734.1 DsbA family protein [Undibacterium fentianense]
MLKFLYVADPMCSWCYGFSKELVRFLENKPNAELDIVLGGLRAYNTEVLDADQREMILSHWDRVQQVSGLPFNMTGLDKSGFIYDTEPACRAVVAAKILTEDMPTSVNFLAFQAIQHAFYAEAQDITDEHVLAEIVVEALNRADRSFTFDVASFLETMTDVSTKEETRMHFQQIQRWGIRGFPVLLLVQEDGLHMLSSGYAKCEEVAKNFEALFPS